MSDPQPPEVDMFVSIMRLRAQWEQSPFGAGESAWHFAQINSPVGDLQTPLWELWRDNIKPHWTERRPDGWIFQRVLVEDVWPGVRDDLEIDLNESQPPGSPGGAPSQITPIITWQTPYKGRSYRGRTYWGQIAADDLYYSGFSPGLFTNLANFGNAMQDTFFAAGPLDAEPKLCIFSRQHDLAPEPFGRYAMVTVAQLRPYLAIQRRRQTYYQ
jgi:hypothetical protein